jgi:hypothetical protein
VRMWEKRSKGRNEYGMVWYGMVWYGMVWYGMVWYGMVWYGMVWYGMVVMSAIEGMNAEWGEKETMDGKGEGVVMKDSVRYVER